MILVKNLVICVTSGYEKYIGYTEKQVLCEFGEKIDINNIFGSIGSIGKLFIINDTLLDKKIKGFLCKLVADILDIY